MSQQKFLVALDGSEQQEAVFTTALQLAQHQAASLDLFHCLPFDSQDLTAGSYSDLYGQDLVNFSRSLQDQIEQQQAKTRLWLAAYGDRAQQAGVEVAWDWKIGEPSQGLLEAARRCSPDLIVMGRRGRVGLAELLLGSVSNYIVHRARCSVLVVQGQQAPLGPAAKILVALDRAPTAEALFQQALALAQSQPARLLFFHCQPVEERLEYFGEVYSEELVQQSQSFYQGLETAGREDQAWLEGYSQRAIAAGVEAVWELRIGGAGFSVCDCARDWGATLILMGRRGRSRWDEWLLGSTSNYVLHHAPCATWIAQAREDAKPTVASGVL